MQFDLEGARKVGYSDLEIVGFLSSQSEFDLEAARRAGYSDGEIIVHLTKPKPWNVTRGFKVAMKQMPQLGYGLAALASAAVETAFGEGGLSTAAKHWALKGYEDWGQSITKEARETDDFNVAWERAREGDYGALVDWLGYGLGYAVGQGAQILGAAGLGAVAGRLALKPAAERLAASMVTKEAERLAASEVGRRLTREAVQKAAVGEVAASIGRWGVLGASAFGMEGGEIGGEMVSAATEEGRTLSGAELGRAAWATALAGGLEFVGNALGYGALTGRLAKGPVATMTGAKGRAARGITSVVFAAPGEAATEYFQTGLEEYGAGKEEAMTPSGQSERARREAIAAAAQGALGGTVMGAAGGALTPTETRERRIERRTAETVDHILSAESADQAIAAAVAPVFESDVATSPLGGLISREMDVAVGRAERAVREEPAYAARTAQQASTRERDIERMLRERQDTGAEAAIAQSLRMEAEAAAPQERLRGPMQVAWGRLILERMEALERAKAAEEPRTEAEEQPIAPAESAQPAPAGEAAGGAREEIRVFGRPLEQLTDKELLIAAQAHRMSAFREAARAALERRKEARRDRQDQQGLSGALGEGQEPVQGELEQGRGRAPAETGRVLQVPEQGAAEQRDEVAAEQRVSKRAPLLVFGKRLEELDDKGLALVAKAGAPALKEAAQAEIERRKGQSQEPGAALQPTAAPGPTEKPPAPPIAEPPPPPGSRAGVAGGPVLRINGQLPSEMTVRQLQIAAREAQFHDQKKAAAAELKHRDRKGETVLGRTVDQLTDKELAVVQKKGRTVSLREQAGEEAKKRATADQTLTDALKDEDIRAIVKSFGDSAGWAQRGGHMIRMKTGERAGEEKISRTTWIPKAEWWRGRPVAEGEQFYREAVARALTGDPLTRKQKDVVRFLVGLAKDEATGTEVPEGTIAEEAQQADTASDAAVAMIGPDWRTMSEDERNAELDALFGPEETPAQGAQPRARDGAAETRPFVSEGREPGQDDEEVARPSDALARQLEAKRAELARLEAIGDYRTEKLRDDVAKIERGLEAARETERRVADRPARIAALQERLERRAAEDRPALELTEQTEANLRAKEAQAATGTVEERTAAVRDRNEAILTPPEGTAPPASAAEQRVPTQQAGLFGNAVAALRTAADELEKVATTAPQERITDVGEKIGGARKDTAAKTGPKTTREETEESAEPGWHRRFEVNQIVGSTRAEENGRWVVRDTRSKNYLGQARQLVGETFATKEDAEAMVPVIAVALKHLAVPVRIASKPMTEAEVDAMVAKDAAAVEADRSLPGRMEYMVMETGRRRLAKGEITQAQFDILASEYAEAAKQYTPPATPVIKEAPTQAYEIWRDVTDRKRVKVVDRQFDTRDDAMRYMAAHAAEIIETKTGFGEEILPHPETVVRRGPERRRGDVKGEDFRQAFGFRAVEFGNWESQEERQEVMNHAYDALMDLADVLGVPPRALGLDGELALAFGARGHGLTGARAHYERDYGVINLTKMKGAGSLAHEWLHAADHYFGRQDSKAKVEKLRNARGDLVYPAETIDRDMASYGFSKASGVRPDLAVAYDEVIKTLMTKAETYVEDTQRAEEFVGRTRDELRAKLDGIRSDLARQLDPNYWKRNNIPATAEQLAAFDALAEKLVQGEFLETEHRMIETASKKSRFGVFRTTNDALEQLSAIYKAVRGRSGFTSERTGVFDGFVGYMNRYAQRVKMLEAAKTGEQKERRVPTSFAMEATSIDQGRTKDYWATPHEMAARAFQAYVEDRIADRGGQSDFLTYGTNVAVPTPWGWKRPFPAGTERVAINEAFDKFVAELKTKETDRGVALFSRGGEGAGLTRDAFRQALSRAFGQRATDRLLASGLVTPLETQGELPEHVVPFVREGDRIYGFYDPKTDRTYAILENLAAEDVKGLVLHEVGVHYGFEKMLGAEKFAQVTRRLDAMRRAGNEKVREARETAEREAVSVESLRERGMSQDAAEAKRAAQVEEETLAYLVQRHPAMNIVREIIAAIKAFLYREFGILGDSLTEADIVMLAQAVVMRAGMQTASSPELASAFSRTPEGESFDGETALDQILRNFKTQVDQVLAADTDRLEPIKLSDNAPASLQAFGWRDLQVRVRAGDDGVRKMHFQHGLTTDEIARLVPETLKRPAMILQHAGQGGVESIRFIAKMEKGDRPIVVAVHPEKAGRYDLEKNASHLVATMFPLGGGWQAVANAVRSGNLLYRDTTFAAPEPVRNAIPEAQKKYAREPRVLLGLIPSRASIRERAYMVLTESALVKWERENWGDNPLFSRATTAPAEARESARPGSRASWDAGEPGRLDAFIRVLQDKQIDTKRVVQAIKNAAGTLKDSVDVYLQEELFHGRVAKAVHDFLDNEYRPLFGEMVARHVTMAELEEYLHARHAEERNAQIAKVNPEMPDGGSGMTNAEAHEYLGKLDPAKRRAYEALAKRVNAINAKTREELIAYGLESPETVRAWESAYEHYVPLHREDMEGGMGTGQGFSVRGPATKRATGSKRKVVDILANVAMQRERALVRGEKNRVSNALMGLAKENPNPDFWKVDQPPKLKVVNERTGLVEERVDPLYKSRENVVVARIPDAKGNVVEHAVVFNESDERAMRMAVALKNLDAHDLGEVLALSAKITRYFASINTQYNPVFGVVNLTRDTQGALFNLSSTPLAGKQLEVLRHTLDALRGIYIDSRAVRHGEHPTSAWAQLFEEFQKEGGQTGYRDMFRTSKDRVEAIEREIAKVSEGKAKHFGRAVFDLLSDYNNAMENAVRLAAYKVGKEHGLSNQRAASLAKNLTVNFNRRGSYGTQIGALYAFFNASVQGTARLAETLRGPAGKRIITGGLLLGSMQALLLAAAGFDDEPPEFVRERSLVLPIGDKKYITIPMPLGLHILPNLGRIPTEFVLSGFRDPQKRFAELVNVFTDAFNPIGNAGLSLQTIAPTVIDPVAALAENKDWTGKPIAREDFNKLAPTPGHTRAKDTATEFSKAVSKALNWLSGGTNYKPGIFSPTPDQLDYLAGQLTGGLGREALKLEQTVISQFSGEELPTYKIPLLGRFYGSSEGQAPQANTFYSHLRAINEHESEIKGRIKAGEPVGEYIAENPEARLIRYANHVERQVSQLRRQKRELTEKGAERERIKAIDDRLTQIMRAFNERVRATRDRVAA